MRVFSRKVGLVYIRPYESMLVTTKIVKEFV